MRLILGQSRGPGMINADKAFEGSRGEEWEVFVAVDEGTDKSGADIDCYGLTPILMRRIGEYYVWADRMLVEFLCSWSVMLCGWQ